MTLRRLELSPDQARYSAAFGPAVQRVAVAGGRARHRLDQLGAPALINCQWFADPVEHDYLLAFYRTVRAEGAGPFRLDLWLDDFPLIEYQASFTSPLQLGGQSGDAYMVAARLEAGPWPRNAVADQALIDSFAEAVDGLQVMGLDVSSAGYSATRGDELLVARPGFGPAGIRAGLEREASLIRVSWTTNARGYEYLIAFYFTGIREAALPFRITLVLDNSAPAEYVAVMIPGSFSLDSVEGLTFRVSCDLEVVTNPRDAGADAAILAAFPEAP